MPAPIQILKRAIKQRVCARRRNETPFNNEDDYHNRTQLLFSLCRVYSMTEMLQFAKISSHPQNNDPSTASQTIAILYFPHLSLPYHMSNSFRTPPSPLASLKTQPVNANRDSHHIPFNFHSNTTYPRQSPLTLLSRTTLSMIPFSLYSQPLHKELDM